MVCSDSLTTSSGTLTCTIPSSYGNETIISTIYINNKFVVQKFVTLSQDRREVFGYTGYILAFVLIVTMSLMFISSPIGTIIGSIMGMVVLGMMWLLEGGTILSATSTIMWLIVASVIIIWRISQIQET